MRRTVEGFPHGRMGARRTHALPGDPVTNLSVLIPLAAVVGILQTSLFEWIYHRYWLHRPWLPPQMFTAHTLVHHQLCKHEDTFEVTDCQLPTRLRV